MTCIAAVSDGHRVWMAGDRCVSDDVNVSRMADPKVWHTGTVLIGAAGGMPFMNATHSFDPQSEPGAEDLLMWVVEDMVPQLRRHMRKRKVEDLGELLVAHRGAIVQLDSYLGAYESTRGYATIGSGSQVALGALGASETARDPSKRLRRVMRVVARHCPSVSRPFDIRCSDPDIDSQIVA